jgi:putative oxidoreductase
VLEVIFPPFITGRGAVGLLIVRMVCGAALVVHGSGKIQNPFGWMGPEAPVPALLQGLAALSEFGGGLAWMAGALTPLASLGLFCTMSVAASHHLGNGDPFVGHGGPSYELALAYWSVALLLLLIGPGAASLDARLFRRRTEGAGSSPRNDVRGGRTLR